MANAAGKATRIRILGEFGKVQTQIAKTPESWRKLSFKAHKKICGTMGDDFVDYPEFEFWFSRFARGNFDLNYDRSGDPKTRSLTDLPLEIFKKIGENLKLHDRLLLRDVCKDIRFHVDNWDLRLTKIYYSSANDWRVWQTSRPGFYCADNFGRNQNNRFRPGFYRNPISFLMSVLKLPKLQVEKLTIYEQDECWEKLIKRLDKSNRKLHVKKIQIPYFRSSKFDMNFMIPGVLEEITLSNPKREILYDVVESEQCQAAKMVHIDSDTVTSKFPLNVLYNCPRFTLHVYAGADGLKSKFLKTLMKRGEVEKCVLYISTYLFPENRSQIMKYFNEPEAMVPNFPSLRRYPISRTNEFYELEYRVEIDDRERTVETFSLERKQ